MIGIHISGYHARVHRLVLFYLFYFFFYFLVL